MIALLKNNGAEVETKSKLGCMALYYAELSGAADAIALLK